MNARRSAHGRVRVYIYSGSLHQFFDAHNQIIEIADRPIS